MEREKKTRGLTCYVNGNCDWFFDDFYNLKMSYYPNMYRINNSQLSNVIDLKKNKNKWKR